MTPSLFQPAPQMEPFNAGIQRVLPTENEVKMEGFPELPPLKQPKKAGGKTSRRFSSFGLSILLLTLSSSTVLAHPFAAKIPAQQLILKLSPSLIRLEYRVEVPTAIVMEAFYLALKGQPPSKEADAAFTKTQLAGFLEGLTLSVDGKAIPWKDVSDPRERNGVGNMQYFAYHLELEAPWTPTHGRQHMIVIRNSNFDSTPGYFQHQIWKMGDIRILDATLLYEEAPLQTKGDKMDRWVRRISDPPFRVRIERGGKEKREWERFFEMN